MPRNGQILDSWKEIAAYLGRAVRTVQTWERSEGLPVHRHQHRKAGTVYAYPGEIDTWRKERAGLANGVADLAGRRRRKVHAAIAAATAVALAAGSWLLYRAAGADRESEPADTILETRGWLMIGGFDNRTEIPHLGDTLAAALRRELANSSHLKVAPKERIGDVLQLMGRPSDSAVDAELAREVAVRDGGIRAVLGGRVDGLGSSYVLSIHVLNAADGVTLASLSAEAGEQESILPAVTKLSRELRQTLGEALAEADPAERLSRVTTPSLRALELYSRADRLLLEETLGGPAQNEAAEQLLREAIAKDPEFASSYTHLAWALRRQSRPESEYLPFARTATELMGKATAVERCFIRGSLYTLKSEISGRRSDLEAALTQYQALLQLDPGHAWASRNAAGALQELDRGSEVLELLRGLVEARPHDVATLARAARELVVATGNLDRARSLIERIRRIEELQPPEARSRDGFVELFPVHAAWVRGDLDGALGELDRVAASLDRLPAPERRSLATTAQQHYLDLGMFEKADALQRKYSAPDRTFWEWRLAWRRGDGEHLRESMLRRYREGNLFQTVRVAYILGQFGFLTEAGELLARLPPDFDLEMALVTAARGFVHLAGGRPREAISHLEAALPMLRHDVNLGSYFYTARSLSRAWEALGQPERGIAVLEEAARQKPSALLVGHWWMELRLQLAELYRSTGRVERAGAIEDDLRRHCAHADSDFPILRELERRGARATV